MNRTSMWCFVVLLSFGSAERLVAQGSRSTEEAVVRLEQQWFEAQHTCDQLAPLLADKVVIMRSDGEVINKTEELATCKDTKWSRIRLRDPNLGHHPNFAIFGDTVITTVDFEGEGTDASGKPFEVHERWTHTWVKMPSGQWQYAAIYTSPITM
jgi:ketosteroid isomerase-like protein